MPLRAAEAWQAAFEVFTEVALDGAPGDVGVSGDRVMAQAVALEPEHLHLALDAGVGVVVPVVGQSFPVVRREGDDPHDGSTRCCPQVVPRQQLTPTHCRLQFVPDPAAPSIHQGAVTVPPGDLPPRTGPTGSYTSKTGSYTSKTGRQRCIYCSVQS